MSATPEAIFKKDNQITLAVGDPPLMYAKQGGVHPCAEKRGVSDAWEWAHKQASSSDADAWPTWRKTECTGVHAEMLIVRAWVIQLVMEGHTITAALDALRGRRITASQPACWCCAAFMKHYGIAFPEKGKSNKPLTGWRHPLAVPRKTISNAQMSELSFGDVTLERLEALSGL